MTRIPDKYRADLVMLAITFIWGASFSLMRNVINFLPAIPYLALRFSIASIILLTIFRKRLAGLNKKILLQGAVIALTYYFGMSLQVFGLYYTTATNSAFITGLCFVMVPAFSALMLKKRPKLYMIIGVVVAAFGMLTMTGGLDSRFNFGDFLTLLCAVSWALEIIIIDKYSAESDGALLGLVSIAFAAVMFLITWGITDRSPVALNNPFIWGVLLWTGLGGTAFAFAGQTIMQKYTTPTHTAVIFSMEPVFGLLFALLLPAVDGSVEVMTLAKGIGCALIFAGMMTCEVGGALKDKKAATIVE